MSRAEPEKGGTARLRVVTIGAGYFSAFHVDAWRRIRDAEFAGIADLDEHKARCLAKTPYDGEDAKAFTDSRRMFETLKPDIVDIAVPPAAHLEQIEIALGSSARTIVCQKPFCTTIEQARRAIAMAEQAGKLLIVHENFRFQPWYRILAEEIRAGKVGDLYQIAFRLRPGDGQGESAYLSRQPYFQTMKRFLIHETAVHWIDTFRFLLGEPEAVMADLRQLNPVIAGEDSGLFIFRFADGRRALFDGNRLVDHASDNPRLTMGECLVEGSKGVIFLDGYGTLRHRHAGSQAWTPVECDYSREGFGGDCVFALQKHVTDHLLYGTPVENEARSYLCNIEIELAIYESARSGQTIRLPDR